MSDTFRKLSPSIWYDERFMRLGCRARLMFIYILTHPQMTSLGAMRATPQGLCAELGFEQTELQGIFSELAGMVVVEPANCLVFCPNYLRYNQPANPKMVAGWRYAFDRLPKCASVMKVLAAARESLRGRDQSFQQAFAEAFPEMSQKGTCAASGQTSGSVSGQPGGNAADAGLTEPSGNTANTSLHDPSCNTANTALNDPSCNTVNTSLNDPSGKAVNSASHASFNNKHNRQVAVHGRALAAESLTETVSGTVSDTVSGTVSGTVCDTVPPLKEIRRNRKRDKEEEEEEEGSGAAKGAEKKAARKRERKKAERGSPDAGPEGGTGEREQDPQGSDQGAVRESRKEAGSSTLFAEETASVLMFADYAEVIRRTRQAGGAGPRTEKRRRGPVTLGQGELVDCGGVVATLLTRDGAAQVTAGEMEYYADSYPDLDIRKVFRDMETKLRLVPEARPEATHLNRWIYAFLKNESGNTGKKGFSTSRSIAGRELARLMAKEAEEVETDRRGKAGAGKTAA